MTYGWNLRLGWWLWFHWFLVWYFKVWCLQYYFSINDQVSILVIYFGYDPPPRIPVTTTFLARSHGIPLNKPLFSHWHPGWGVDPSHVWFRSGAKSTIDHLKRRPLARPKKGLQTKESLENPTPTQKTGDSTIVLKCSKWRNSWKLKRTQKILLHSAKQKSVNLKHIDTTNQLLNRIFCCFKSLCSLKLQIPSTKKHKNNRKTSPFRRCIFLKNTGNFDCHRVILIKKNIANRHFFTHKYHGSQFWVCQTPLAWAKYLCFASSPEEMWSIWKDPGFQCLIQ